MAIGELQHETLGSVRVTVRQNSRHVSARWKGGLVSLNVPQGIRIPDLHRILDDLTPRLLANRPEINYFDGQELQFPDVDFVIRQQSFASERTTRAISEMLCKIARKVAPQVLIPHARDIATRLGRGPVGWTISSGHRILGQCNGRGIISLSYVLVFLPDDLRDYVICHEIAHLSEMNHGEKFHKLLDSYLDGREAELVRKLHSHK